jgi:hypothetical protein
MAGIALYNKFIPHKNFEYLFMPMYSFGTKSLAGSASISNTFYFQKSFIHHLEISAGVKRYAYDKTNVFITDQDMTDYYFVQAPVELTFTLKQSNDRSTIKRKIILRNINVWQDENVYISEGNGMKENKYLPYFQTIFDFRNNRNVHGHVFYRWLNELPTLILIGIVILVVVKPF